MFGSVKRRWSGRNLLIGGQVAMSVGLLVFAGIFLRTQYAMFTTDRDFETRHVLIVPLQAEPGRYTTDSAVSFHETLAQRVSTLPGVQSLCYANAPPGALEANPVEIRLPEQEPGSGGMAGINVVSADFFATFRIPLIAGRTFLVAERFKSSIPNSTLEVVASESLARKFWGNEDALGKVVVDGKGDRMQIVGIARDTESAFGGSQSPQLYRQFNPQHVSASMMIRFAGDARPISQAVRTTVQEMDHEMIVAPQTLRFMLDEVASRFWVIVRLILLLGLLALLIAVIGIYGVVAFAVNRRTKEMGIRLALGATRGNIMRLVLRSSLKPILAGLATGLGFAAAGSYVIAQTMREMPVRVEARDPLIYFAVSLLLLLAAVAAIVGPARRAMKADPVRSLRQE